MKRATMDTNTISLLASDYHLGMTALLSSPNYRVILADFIHRETQQGRPENEAAFLQSLQAEWEPPSPEARFVEDLLVNLSEKVLSDLIDSHTPNESYSSFLEAHGLGAKSLNNLAPPNVISKLLDQVASNPEALAAFSFLSEHTEDASIQATVSALMLTMLGFQKDKNLFKKNLEVRRNAIRRQMKDAMLVGFGCDMNMLVSSDARLCKLAYSIYEYYDHDCVVCFYRDRTLTSVGFKTWPDIR